MKRTFGKLLAGAALLLAAGAAVTGVLAQAKKTKVAFVYVGPIGDHGWSYQHHQGLLAIQKEFVATQL